MKRFLSPLVALTAGSAVVLGTYHALPTAMPMVVPCNGT